MFLSLYKTDVKVKYSILCNYDNEQKATIVMEYGKWTLFICNNTKAVVLSFA